MNYYDCHIFNYFYLTAEREVCFYRMETDHGDVLFPLTLQIQSDSVKVESCDILMLHLQPHQGGW